MAVKTSNQHHIGRFEARTGEGSAPHLCVPTQIQLKTVKMVKIGMERVLKVTYLEVARVEVWVVNAVDVIDAHPEPLDQPHDHGIVVTDPEDGSSNRA